MLPPGALALPTGGVVEGGNAIATISSGANTTTINQMADRGVINWNTFNVGTSEAVRFNQPSVTSMTLNRVVADANPSQILGSISANGRVIIANPNGMVFGPESRVDVAGIIATTANIKSNNFLNDQALKFNEAGARNAKIEIQNGAIINSTAEQNGLVAVVAPQVVNNGVLVANRGQVVLAGAETATVDLNGDGLVSFAVSNRNSDTLVRHAGYIEAEGGRVLLTAKAASNVVNNVVNTQGVPDAEQLIATANGLVLVEGDINATGNAGLKTARVTEGPTPVTKGGTVEMKGRDIIVRNGATVDVSDTQQGGVIFANAERHAILGGSSDKMTTMKGSFSNEPVSGGGHGAHLIADANSEVGKTKAGTIKVLAQKGTAALLDDADISASGYNGGKLELSGADILLAGGMQAMGFGGKGGSILIDPATIIINNGGNNGLLNNISEQWIENKSQAGMAVSIVATDLIRMQNLKDNELTGGAGDITLRTLAADSAIRFDSNGDMIRTTSGDVTLLTGSGGINIGSIRTGINGAYPALDAPTGDIQAGDIRLTSSGGDITVQDLVARGTDKTTSILVDAGKDFTARSLLVRVDDQPDPGTADTARISVKAGGDITVKQDVLARAWDDQGATRNARAFINLEAVNDVFVKGQVYANADGGVRKAGDEGESRASIRISGNNVELHRVHADADGGNDAFADVTIDAKNQYTAHFDVISLAKKTVIGTGNAIGNIFINAHKMLVPITDTIAHFKATNNVTINSPIVVRTPEDAIIAGGTTVPMRSDRLLKLEGGNSVTVSGDIDSFTASVIALAGQGGIKLDNVSTGSLTFLTTPTAPFQAGSIALTTTNGGDITVGDLSTAGTFGTTTINADSAGDLTTDAISMFAFDDVNRGSVDLIAASLKAAENILLGGSINITGEDNNGATRSSVVALDVTAGKDIKVTGDVNVLAQGGFRGRRPTDTGTSSATAYFIAGENLTLGNVDVQALGGTNAFSYLFMGAPNGTVTLGTTRSRTITTDISEAGDPVNGTANATLEIVALGTPADSDANIVYNGANPFAEANTASRQGRYSDFQTVGSNTGRLIIINPQSSGPDGPIDPGTPITPGGTLTPTITPAINLVALEEIELNRQSDFAQNLYSYFGETLGDQYYFGNTDVNLTLLGGGNRLASFGNDATSLANLSPASGGGQGQTQRRARLTGGSESKRARYAWVNTGGTAPVEAGRSVAPAGQLPQTASADTLANLSPAAGGNTGEGLNNLAPASGGEGGSCANNYLDAGYAADFDGATCREEQRF